MGTTERQRAFDVCWDAYRNCRDAGGLRAGDIVDGFQKKKQWRPAANARATDYCADFAGAGLDALTRAGQSSRLILFRVFYLGLAPYHSARHFLGLSDLAWVQWTEQIREIVGRELMARGLDAVKEYFE